MEQQMPQGPAGYEQPAPKKGMSKGCLVALIIVGVLIVMVVVAGLVCYMKRDDLMKFGAVSLVEEVKKNMEAEPQPGVDTVKVNAVADEVIAHLNSEEPLDLEALGMFVQNIQHIRTDGKVDSLEAAQFVSAAVNYYPAAAEATPAGSIGDMPDTTTAIDTTDIQ